MSHKDSGPDGPQGTGHELTLPWACLRCSLAGEESVGPLYLFTFPHRDGTHALTCRRHAAGLRFELAQEHEQYTVRRATDQLLHELLPQP